MDEQNNMPPLPAPAEPKPETVVNPVVSQPVSQPPVTSSPPSVSPPTIPVPPPPVSFPEEGIKPEHKPKTLITILVVIVVLLIIGALVMVALNFSGKSVPVKEEVKKETQEQSVKIPQPTLTYIPVDSDTKALSTQGTSDEITDIEKDLNNTDFSNLDREVEDINSQL